ncbi:MAG: insulinase family protein, partial [Spirochaetales bacterium]|nr:insulinase family protein [Spirochaetales bacterium]
MQTIKPGDKMHGFTLVSISDQEEYKGKGYTFKHDKTGLELFHLHNDDTENLFSFTFKTPASDNKGVAHILEHSVLSGSEKYPVKDPFMALMKGSMNTFLNAMTYPEKTVYPAASPVEKDYFNMMSVYADAVFFPLLKKEV